MSCVRDGPRAMASRGWVCRHASSLEFAQPGRYDAPRPCRLPRRGWVCVGGIFPLGHGSAGGGREEGAVSTPARATVSPDRRAILSVKCEIYNSDLVSGARVVVVASILPIGTQPFFGGLGKTFRLCLAWRTEGFPQCS